MAEAEDVITDVARHATVFTQALWRRHRSNAPAKPMTRGRDDSGEAVARTAATGTGSMGVDGPSGPR